MTMPKFEPVAALIEDHRAEGGARFKMLAPIKLDTQLFTLAQLTEAYEAGKRDAVPAEAIGNILAEVMDIAVSNGANSISMPDEYVEVAVWLSGLEPAAPKGE